MAGLWFDGWAITFDYNKKEWKFVIPYKTSDNKYTVYIIDTKKKEIKNINVGLRFEPPFWRDLEFILPNIGFVASKYTYDTHSFHYHVYDFDWNLLIRNTGRQRDEQSPEDQITWMRKKVEEANKQKSPHSIDNK